uniref:uncharacterized protein LOC122599522 n=1 Tax=Erigeron canadensis TaxID=72917 RepID=UPI001CB8FB1F|nr:uncharacterized protein LOC122599522 [Erigeron canadensis]
MRIGNGKNTSAWFDAWSESGPLCEIVTPREIKNAGLTLEAKVADICRNGEWVWPNAWYVKYPSLMNEHVPHLDQNKNDEVIWIDNAKVEQPYTTTIAWNSIRCNEQKVAWMDFVWSPHNIPRHSFHLWLIMRRKLLTQDRIIKWASARRNNMNMMCCALCKANYDSHNHLLFESPFSTQVWLKVRDMGGLQHLPPLLDVIMDWMNLRAKSRLIANVVGRLLVASTAYFLWQERNNRMFNDQARPPDLFCEVITSTVRLKLMTFKFQKTTRVIHMLEAWGICGDSVFIND